MRICQGLSKRGHSLHIYVYVNTTEGQLVIKTHPSERIYWREAGSEKWGKEVCKECPMSVQ